MATASKTKLWPFYVGNFLYLGIGLQMDMLE